MASCRVPSFLAGLSQGGGGGGAANNSTPYNFDFPLAED